MNVTKLPEKKGMIGFKEIMSGIKTGKIKKVVVANNCPQFLADKLGIPVDVFEGDQSQLGTKLGKPFSVSMVGYEE